MPEMLRINDEVNRLITSVQVTLRIQTGYRISKIEVVRRAMNDLAEKLSVPRLPEDDGLMETDDDAGG